jgi:hypothetical protein
MLNMFKEWLENNKEFQDCYFDFESESYIFDEVLESYFVFLGLTE